MPKAKTPLPARMHTPVGVACYVNLLQPRAQTDRKGQAKGDPQYSITLFFRRDQEDELAAMMDVAEGLLIEAFGKDAMNKVNRGKINWPFRDTEDMDDPKKPFDEPGWSVSFKTYDKPGIVDANAEPIMDKGEIYSGMLARVSCNPRVYDNESQGVTFYLVNAQKIDDGERLAGNPAAEDDFGDAPKGRGRSASSRGRSTSREEDEPAPRRGASKRGGSYGGLI